MSGSRLFFKLLAVLLPGLSLVVTPVCACTLFVIHDDSTVVLGRTLDWDTPLPGAVYVNPRGLVKTTLPWHGWWPVAGESSTKLWAAVYGSVTFSAYGRDFIASGMNEAGLVVAEASWAGEYGPVDDRPSVCCAQWLQYQLDNFATVAEVVSHVDELRLDGEGWHFLVADASGDVAVIESSADGAVVFRGPELDYPVLTNAGCKQLAGFRALASEQGDPASMKTGEDSYARYLRAVSTMDDMGAAQVPVTPDAAWRVIDSVRVSDTRREIVFDATNRTVTWTTAANEPRRTLHVDDLQLAPRSPVLMMNLDAPNTGDVAWALLPYSLRWNREVVDAALRAIHGEEVPEEPLAPRGFTFEQAVELIATHPR